MKEMIEQDALPQVADEQAGVELNGQGQVRRWKTYAEYKDSGVEWLGEIPVGWEVRRIKHIAINVSKGTTPTTIGRIYLDDGKIRFIKAENIVDSKLSEYPAFFIDDATNLLLRRSVLKERDVLIVIAGATIGKTCVLTKDYLPANTNQAVAFIRLRNISYADFLFYWLTASNLQEQIKLKSVQSAQPNISLEDIKNFILPFPPEREMQQIVSYIMQETTRINTLIAKKEQHVALLQERRRAIINQAVTKGLNANVAMKDSGVEWLGEIPEHWDIRKLKYDAKFFSGGTPSKANANYWSGEIPWVSPKDMKAEIILDTEDHISEEALRESATHLITEEAVLIVVRSGILKHSIPIAINQVPVTINQDIKAIKLNKKILPKYLAALFNSHQQVLLVEWRKAGATVESIEYDLLISTRICIPPIEEQHSIVAYLEQETNKIDRLITGIQESIKKLKEYSTALISAAVTGKIDVRGEVADGGAEDVTV